MVGQDGNELWKGSVPFEFAQAALSPDGRAVFFFAEDQWDAAAHGRILFVGGDTSSIATAELIRAFGEPERRLGSAPGRDLGIRHFVGWANNEEIAIWSSFRGEWAFWNLSQRTLHLGPSVVQENLRRLMVQAALAGVNFDLFGEGRQPDGFGDAVKVSGESGCLMLVASARSDRGIEAELLRKSRFTARWMAGGENRVYFENSALFVYGLLSGSGVDTPRTIGELKDAREFVKTVTVPLNIGGLKAEACASVAGSIQWTDRLGTTSQTWNLASTNFSPRSMAPDGMRVQFTDLPVGRYEIRLTFHPGDGRRLDLRTNVVLNAESPSEREGQVRLKSSSVLP